jgi:hypothetical protein
MSARPQSAASAERASPEAALERLAEELRREGAPLADVVRPAEGTPALGLLAAAGPRATEAPADYALLVEAVREGYLLHYGRPRVLAGLDDDLALLAGDHLYARGLERLAAHGDLAAVRELADLISLSARLHADRGFGADGEGPAAAAMWLASAVAVGAGSDPGHERAKEALRRGSEDAAELLAERAAQAANGSGMRDTLGRAAESVGLRQHFSSY